MNHAELIERLMEEGRVWREQVGEMPLFVEAANALRDADTRAAALEAIIREGQSHHFAAGSL